MTDQREPTAAEVELAMMVTNETIRAVNAEAEVERLLRWKAEAAQVIRQWEEVFEALGRPGWLGQVKSEAALAEVKRRNQATQGLVSRLSIAGDMIERWNNDFPCDGGCQDEPEETCSAHGRRPAELWRMLNEAKIDSEDRQR